MPPKSKNSVFFWSGKTLKCLYIYSVWAIVGIPDGKTPFFKKRSFLGTPEKAQNHAKHYIYSGLEGFEEPRNQQKTDPKVTQKRKSVIIERIAKSAQVPYI